jgi:hypothetical protein
MISRAIAPSLVLGLVAACEVDAPNPIPAPGTSALVDRLSGLRVFTEPLADLEPAEGVIPYDVVAPLYADRAEKRRFIVMPPGEVLTPAGGGADDHWEIPIGTYFIKNFYFPRDARDPDAGIQLIETRFLVRKADGYTASTYLWNADQTDALVSGGNVDVPVHWIDEAGVERDQLFHVPGTSFCHVCHDDRVLGIRTRQMARPDSYPDGSDNQLDYKMSRWSIPPETVRSTSAHVAISTRTARTATPRADSRRTPASTSTTSIPGSTSSPSVGAWTPWRGVTR